MQRTFIFLLLLIFSFSKSQKVADSTSITTLNAKALLYDNYSKTICYGNGDSNNRYDQQDLLYVCDIVDCFASGEKKKFAKVYYDSKPYYVELADNHLFLIDSEKATIEDIESFVKSLSDEEKEKLEKNAKRRSEIYISYIEDALEKKVFANEKYGIGILKANPTEDYSFTGAEFKIFNFSKKKIKYVTFNFYGKNAVKDRVGQNKSRKGIGPVESYTSALWSFDSVWLTDIVQTLELVSMHIIYMDGTTKTVTGTDKLWIDRDAYDRLLRLDNN